MSGDGPTTAVFRPSERVRELAEAFALGRGAKPRGGPAGETLGRELGSSLEFADRRDYQAGDDLRSLDWAAYARSDQLLVRLTTEQVAPEVHVALDLSRSMALDPGKAQLAVDVAELFGLLASASGSRLVEHGLGASPRPIERRELASTGVAFTEPASLEGGLAHAVSRTPRGALFVVVSDFLVEQPARSLLGPLHARRVRPLLVQVLSPFESDPSAHRGAAVRLEDVESEGELDLILDDAALERYRRRLESLRADLRAQAHRSGGEWLSLEPGTGLTPAALMPLVAAGVLEGSAG